MLWHAQARSLAKRVNHTPRTLRMRLAKRILRTSRQSRSLSTYRVKPRHEHLSREVRGLRIVDDATVDVLASELPAVVRPSGTGKSSFLRLLT